MLTGFKWIGDQIAKLEADGEVDRFIFGFEESYGYLAGYLDADALALVQDGTHMFSFSNLRMTETVEESKAINEDKTPKVIISASGMCDAGRVRHHLKHNLWRPECLVLFVGYQAVGTLGRALHDGAKSVKLFGEEVNVQAEISWLTAVCSPGKKMGFLPARMSAAISSST